MGLPAAHFAKMYQLWMLCVILVVVCADAVRISRSDNGLNTGGNAENTGGNAENKRHPLLPCSKQELSSVKAWLLDLDGTMYSPSALLPGVTNFFDWIEMTNASYILLSNGFRTKNGVSVKFTLPQFKINQVIDPKNVYTAADAISQYFKDNVPKGAKVFVVGTSIEYADGRKESAYRILQQNVPSDLFNSWDLRMDLTLDEIHEWAHLALNNIAPVYVLLASNGNPKDDFGDDPVTKKPSYTQLDYELMKKVNVLLRNDAFLVVGAPDIVESRPKSASFPDVDTTWPTIGGFEQMFLVSSEMFPGSSREKKRHVNVGKGGSFGDVYMMEPAIRELLSRNPRLGRKDIMIVGDNFGTDIRAGNRAGIRSMLVLSGAHQLADEANWPDVQATCHVEDVGKIVDILKG